MQSKKKKKFTMEKKGFFWYNKCCLNTKQDCHHKLILKCLRVILLITLKQIGKKKPKNYLLW